VVDPKRVRLSCAALGALWSACASTPAPLLEAGRPQNIIVILADDVGVEAFGCYGGESYATPNFDRMAAQGVLFENAHSQPLCTPSRVKLLTGRSNLRNYRAFSVLDPRERTLAHDMQDAGYATVAVGKWQLLAWSDYGEWAGKGSTAAQAGFDRWCLWQHDALGSRFDDPKLDTDGVVEKHVGEYGPDLFLDYALDYIEEHRHEPFFMYYPMALVHSPFVPTPETLDREQDKQANFADMMVKMDAIVGDLIDGVDALGLGEDTLILFVGDNGTGRAIRSTRNGVEVMGGKGLSSDRGTHVPMLARWGTRVTAGASLPDLVDLSDFLPTCAQVAGFTPTGRELDGVSFAPRLLGRPGTPRDWIAIYNNPRPDRTRTPPVLFTRDKRYKLYDDGLFFDLASDPEEEAPLEPDQGSQAASRRAALKRALDGLPPLWSDLGVLEPESR